MFAAQRLFQSCSSIASRSMLSRPSTFSTAIPARSVALRALHTNRGSMEMMKGFAQDMFSASEPTTMDSQWKAQSRDALAEAERRPPAHAYSGRSVNVSSGRVADAIRSLDGILNRNKVRYYLRMQQRHEKRGEKLRRLKSERWRKQFANEVRKKVQLVTKIRNRGA